MLAPMGDMLKLIWWAVIGCSAGRQPTGHHWLRRSRADRDRSHPAQRHCRPWRRAERRTVKAHPLPDRDKLLRRLPRMFATAATDMDPKLIRERRQAALQGLPIG